MSISIKFCLRALLSKVGNKTEVHVSGCNRSPEGRRGERVGEDNLEKDSGEREEQGRVGNLEYG